ncbi:HNH endonuclease [Paraburkholderia sediminicola]|uniref:HNH endonuclease n=1 Tax=Paraburkholderia sediminicola TaxID=458836 RepID=UPI0038BE18F4
MKAIADGFRKVPIAALRLVLRYDPLTGKLYWRVKPSGQVSVGDEAGSIEASGHRRIGVFGEQILAHRIAFALYYGRWPASVLDHKDRNRDNNRIKNLREATNGRNRANARGTSKSGYRGVTIEKNGKFRAEIRFEKKLHYLGVFDDPEEAAAVYQAAAYAMHGEFAFLGAPT